MDKNQAYGSRSTVANRQRSIMLQFALHEACWVLNLSLCTTRHRNAVGGSGGGARRGREGTSRLKSTPSCLAASIKTSLGLSSTLRKSFELLLSSQHTRIHISVQGNAGIVRMSLSFQKKDRLSQEKDRLSQEYFIRRRRTSQHVAFVSATTSGGRQDIFGVYSNGFQHSPTRRPNGRAAVRLRIESPSP